MKFCFRCGKQSSNTSNLNSHLKNKKECDSIYLDIPRNEIIHNYIDYLDEFLIIYKIKISNSDHKVINSDHKVITKTICYLCGKKFVHTTNFYRHKRLYWCLSKF